MNSRDNGVRAVGFDVPADADDDGDTAVLGAEAGALSASERSIVESMTGAGDDDDQWQNLEGTPVPEDLLFDLKDGTAAVLYWRALIMPVSPEKKSKGGIIMVAESQENASYLTYIGKVIAVGPLHCKGGAFAEYSEVDDRSRLRRAWDALTGREAPTRWRSQLKTGDWVLYGRHAGQRVEYKGVKFLLVNDDDKLMKVRNPAGWRIYS